MRDVSRETSAQLQTYCDLVRQWTPRINLISRASLDDMWERHVEDSIQVAEAAPGATTWADLGSGGGFPGIVVAICRPQTAVTLIESDARKATFLKHVAIRLNLKIDTCVQRIEEADPTRSMVVSARALAPLDRLLPLATRHGAADTLYVFPKGERYREEIAAAQKSWSFHVDVRPSRIDKKGVILILENVARV